MDREFSRTEWGSVANPYYNPGECGLETVAEIEYSDSSYQFDTRMVWRDVESGTLWTARDAGCSCPSPFEDCHKLSDFERLTTVEQIRDEWKAEIDKGYYHGDSFDKVSQQIAVIEAALDQVR